MLALWCYHLAPISAQTWSKQISRLCVLIGFLHTGWKNPDFWDNNTTFDSWAKAKKTHWYFNHLVLSTVVRQISVIKDSPSTPIFQSLSPVGSWGTTWEVRPCFTEFLHPESKKDVELPLSILLISKTQKAILKYIHAIFVYYRHSMCFLLFSTTEILKYWFHYFLGKWNFQRTGAINKLGRIKSKVKVDSMAM